MQIRNVTLGADIEVFLEDEDSGEIVSAEGIIKGSKEEPFRFTEDKWFSTSLDNVMAEFCIPPVTNGEDFYKNVGVALEYINKNIPGSLRAKITPAARLHEKYLQTENALLFGCEPDYNAWNGIQNLPPGTTTNLRSAGGHIHVGYDFNMPMTDRMIVQALDLYLSVPSVIQEPDSERKELYGKAGAYRSKSYGVEYRSISNYYIGSKELTLWAINNVQDAIEFVNNGGIERMYEEGDEEHIQDAINNNDKVLAQMLIEKYHIKLAA